MPAPNTPPNSCTAVSLEPSRCFTCSVTLEIRPYLSSSERTSEEFWSLSTSSGSCWLNSPAWVTRAGATAATKLANAEITATKTRATDACRLRPRRISRRTRGSSARARKSATSTRVSTELSWPTTRASDQAISTPSAPMKPM